MGAEFPVRSTSLAAQLHQLLDVPTTAGYALHRTLQPPRDKTVPITRSESEASTHGGPLAIGARVESATTAAVAADQCVAEPAVLVAVTASRRNFVRSAVTGTYPSPYALSPVQPAGSALAATPLPVHEYQR